MRLVIRYTFRTYFKIYILKYTLWSISEYSYNEHSVMFLLVIFYYYLLYFAHPDPTFGHPSPTSESLIKVRQHWLSISFPCLERDITINRRHCSKEHLGEVLGRTVTPGTIKCWYRKQTEPLSLEALKNCLDKAPTGMMLFLVLQSVIP